MLNFMDIIYHMSRDIRIPTDQSRCKSLQYYMTVQLLTEHHLKFQSLKRGCTGSSESTLVKMPQIVENHMSRLLFEILFCHFRHATRYKRVPVSTEPTIVLLKSDVMFRVFYVRW